MRASVEAARAMVTQAEAQQGYAMVRAPFDGVVTERFLDPGDLALPGRPLLVLVASGAEAAPVRQRRARAAGADGIWAEPWLAAGLPLVRAAGGNA